VYDNQGRYGEALEHYDQALAILRAVGDRAGEGVTLNNIGGVYEAQGRYGEALEHYEQALAILRAVGDRAGEGVTLNNIGLVYDNQGRYGEALEHYDQALAITREVGDRAGEGATLNNIAAVYEAQGRYGEALEHYEQALAIRRAVGDRAGEGQTLNNIGGVYDNQGRYGEALEHYEQALAITREVGDRAGEGVTLNNIAVVYEAQGQVREALDYYGDSIEVLESVRSIAGSDQARISFAEDYAVVYDRTIALYHQQDAVELAFWYSERGRARTLLDLLATDQVQLSDNQAALLAEGQQAYAIRQAAQEQLAKARAATPPDPAWVAEAEIALEAAEVAYEQIAATIARRSDQLASLIPGRQQVLQLAKVQALLDANTTLLSYWTLEDKTLAFVVTVNDTAIVELPGVTAQAVLTMTENLYHWRNLDNPHPAPLRKLYSLLIAPLADKLHTPHLAIIPHQSLHYVPFAALVDEINGKRYLGEQYTLSLLPSANLLPYLQQNAQAAQANHNANAIVFGDPASDEPDLPRLHYAATEASAVAALLQTSVLTDAAASEADLYQLVQGARVLHLAAHGGYNQANALYSAIYLAPAPPLTQTLPLKVRDGLPTVDTARDGRLETHEIFGLPLKGNDLVVLSACQTNVGELSRGDEVVGLTRAFFFAGSPTVISSLWSVDDAATEALMVSFYKHWLQDGMSKAQALQAAQTDVRTVQGGHWASPFYWAGFVLNGHSGEPVE
jgi:CHAT domain-containing protein/tetratricopeptide (TPR) repeat protein